VTTLAATLDELMDLATALNFTRGPSHRITAEEWLAAREHIARRMARCVGSLRKELGIAAGPPTYFSAVAADGGLSHVRIPGRRPIPIERRRGQVDLKVTAAERRIASDNGGFPEAKTASPGPGQNQRF
jgi:hypothetical protein